MEPEDPHPHPLPQFDLNRPVAVPAAYELVLKDLKDKAGDNTDNPVFVRLSEGLSRFDDEEYTVRASDRSSASFSYETALELVIYLRAVVYQDPTNPLACIAYGTALTTLGTIATLQLQEARNAHE